MALLVTVANVQALTGTTVTAQKISEALAQIDIHAGADLFDDEVIGRLSPRNLRLVQQAVCYQAAWLSTQIDVYSRLDVAEIAGATSNGGVTPRDELTIRLAPLARSCLERCSWRTRKTTPMLATRKRARGQLLFPLHEDTHVSHDPMDTLGQLPNALIDGGDYWGEPTESLPR